MTTAGSLTEDTENTEDDDDHDDATTDLTTKAPRHQRCFWGIDDHRRQPTAILGRRASSSPGVGGVEVAGLGEELVFGHVVFVDGEVADDVFGDFGVVFFELGEEVVHGGAFAGGGAEEEDFSCAGEGFGDGFEEGFGFGFELAGVIFFDVVEMDVRAVGIVGGDAVGGFAVEFGGVDAGLAVVDDDEELGFIGGGVGESGGVGAFEEVADVAMSSSTSLNSLCLGGWMVMVCPLRENLKLPLCSSEASVMALSMEWMSCHWRLRAMGC